MISFFFPCAVGIIKFHRKSLAKSAVEPVWSNTATYRSLLLCVGLGLALSCPNDFLGRKEGRKSQNQADSGILKAFIQ